MNHHAPNPEHLALTRREFLHRCGMGMGALGLASLLSNVGFVENARADNYVSPLLAKNPPLPAKAKRVIHIFANGGPSHVDTFDPKPSLEKYAGKLLPTENLATERKTGAAYPSPFKFQKYGKSGIEVSEIFSKVAENIDDICVIRSMAADVPNHEPSLLLMNCGDARQIRPSVGSWVTYGLGSMNQNLPGFISMCPGGYPIQESQNWQAGFLPGVYQGTYVDTAHTKIEELIQNIKSDYTSMPEQRQQLDLLQQLNERHLKKRKDDAQLEARIQSFELAYRMQMDASDAFDISREPENIRKMYGEGTQARQLLIARRLVERGVRFVQIWHGAGQPWDSHDDIRERHGALAKESDQAIGALLKDLKQRGMLEDTLVIWGGEFGRTPTVELPKPGANAGKVNGRDHNHYGFSMWMAGGGARGGYVHGATDEFGFAAVENKVHVHDLHATILKLLGFDHEKLTFRHSGRDFRLTDVYRARRSGVDRVKGRFFCACVLTLWLGALINSARAADDPAGIEFFESNIRPILLDNCYSCHSQKSEKIKGGLLVDSRDGLLKGGDTGPAIKPGDVEASLLIKAVRYTDDELKMPPKSKKLSAAQIASLETWVKMGAPDPRVASTAVSKAQSICDKAKKHWAFQPVRKPELPQVNEKKLVQTPVDNFILAKLEAAHLKPSPIADKRTLIRRATFDLIGLPPTPEEVSAFEADKSPDAFAKVVDRLLESPHYGERWGRHWLDVARYADSKGYVFEEDRHYPYAYTYRDYVIRSFNEDLPYDQFIKQQIAADLLPDNGDKRSLAALGYITLGRRFINDIHDIIDDRIDVVCRGMMGLTVECARCHDHKFDPIPTKDYYSLYGVFDSSQEPSEEPLLGTKAPDKEFNEYMAEHKKRVEERDKYRQEQEIAMATKLRRQAGDYLFAAYEARPRTNGLDAESVAHTNKLDPEVLRRWMSAMDGWRTNQQAIFAPWFAFADLPENDFPTHAKEVAAKFDTNHPGVTAVNPLVAAAFSGEPPATMKIVAERYGTIFTNIDKQWDALLAATNSQVPAALPNPAEEAVRQILYAADAPANLPRSKFDELYDTPIQQKMRALQRKIDEFDAESPGAPARAMALIDKPDPHDTHVFIRGNAGNEGPIAPREFLEILSGPNRKPFTKGSGRLELAENIASRDNPLTARVFINRVWLHHFGNPLVSTPSDFGLRSDPPTYPELLDYLASRFMDDGWSIKKLHRMIMLSRAYMQSSDENAECAKTDPGNQLLWRMNRQRLEFEPLRDTLLSVSGNLDMKMGGHSVDIIDKVSPRRTLYGYIDRQNVPDLFRAFDLASSDSSSPRRFFTTVPQQALFLMNNSFVVDQAKGLVNRPEFKAAATDKERLRVIYRLAYQREPSHREIDWALRYIRGPALTTPVVVTRRGHREVIVPGNPNANVSGRHPLTMWQKYAQAILMSDELVFVD